LIHWFGRTFPISLPHSIPLVFSHAAVLLVSLSSSSSFSSLSLALGITISVCAIQQFATGNYDSHSPINEAENSATRGNELPLITKYVVPETER
jgi:hypothetical protein